MEECTFEEGMAELEATVRALEGGQLSLNDSFAAYKRGAELADDPEFKRRGPRLIPYLALLREGLALPAQLLEAAAGSYPAFSPLPDCSGGLFSAALSFPWNLVHGILIL